MENFVPGLSRLSSLAFWPGAEQKGGREGALEEATYPAASARPKMSLDVHVSQRSCLNVIEVLVNDFVVSVRNFHHHFPRSHLYPRTPQLHRTSRCTFWSSIASFIEYRPGRGSAIRFVKFALLFLCHEVCMLVSENQENRENH